MVFNKEEKVAIFRVAQIMANIDGKVEETEMGFIVDELKEMGVGLNEAIRIEQSAYEMRPVEAMNILSNLSIEQKKYVCGFLAAMMHADNKCTDSEVVAWKMFSLIAEFPSTTIKDAIYFWQNH